MLAAVEPAGGAAGREARAVRETVLRLWGKRVVFVKQPGGRLFNGTQLPSEPDLIFVSIDSDKQLLTVSRHELLHGLKVDRPDLYKSLAKALTGVVKNLSEHARRLDEPGEG